MKLIATLGATPANSEHIYQLGTQTYRVKISPLALQKHYGIKERDVYILGTEKTKEKLSDVINKFNFVEINEDSLENVFETALRFIQKGDVVDLTQGYRSFPYGVFLALNYSKIMDKDPLDVYYAQVLNIDCNYRNEICHHKFVSLKKYLEIGDLAREIGSFVSSWYVYGYGIGSFSDIEKALRILSKKLLSNDLDVAGEIESIKARMGEIEKNFSFLAGHLRLLNRELNGIKKALDGDECVKLYNMARLYFNKNLLLQSLTVLFESISAYLAKKAPDGYYCEKNGKKYYKNSKNRYAFRNCVKNMLRRKNSCQKHYFKNIRECEAFRKNLMLIDEIRNSSAHAFVNGKTQNHHEEIEKLLEFFGGYLK